MAVAPFLFLATKFRLNFKLVPRKDYLLTYLEKVKIIFFRKFFSEREILNISSITNFSYSNRLAVRAVCQKITSLTSALVKVSDVAGLKIELQKGLSTNSRNIIFFFKHRGIVTGFRNSKEACKNF